VAALGGDPGVRSARFSGIPVDYARNNALLLTRLAGVSDRRARFVTVMALHLSDGREFVRQGTLSGRITECPAGEGGFGYDPLFVPNNSVRTLAEMTMQDKNRISHRYQAVRAMKLVLAEIAAAEA